MNIQVQKEEIEEAVEVLDLRPFARLLEVGHWLRISARTASVALGEAVGLICARVEREPVRAAHVIELRARAKENRRRVRILRDGEEPPKPGPADLKALDRADAVEALAVKGKRGAPAIREEAARQRSAVGDRLKASADARRAEMRLTQTVELDAAREGEVLDRVIEKRRGQTQIRLRTRDGLKLLHERGAFTPKDASGRTRVDQMARAEADRLLSIGLRYRDRYEIAQSSLRSCLATPDSPPPSPNMFVQGKAAQRRAALANQVRVLEVAVSVHLGAEALEALRRVAGEARTLRSLTGSARRRDRMASGLVEALKLIGGILDSRA